MKIEELTEESIGHVGEVLAGDQKRRGLLIHALHQIQKTHNYLPREELIRLSGKLGIALSDVYSTATFYKQFYFNPRGKNVACVCTGTACHVRGAGKMLERFKDEFGIKEGETTPDMSLTLETVGCVGCCGLAPVMTLNEEVIGELDDEKFSQVAGQIRSAR
jgi:NADH-quinone oxidoreductase subunit E